MLRRDKTLLTFRELISKWKKSIILHTPEGKIHKSKAKPMGGVDEECGIKGKQWGSGLT